MKFQALSILVGTDKCDAHCPFCVSKISRTTRGNTENKIGSSLYYKRLEIAFQLAKISNITTCLITGEGEPTLFMDDMYSILERIPEHIPLVELQTNGIGISEPKEIAKRYLGHGSQHIDKISTVSLSCVSHIHGDNRTIYGKSFSSLEQNIEYLHSHGFNVRLSCIGIKGMCDSYNEIQYLIDFAKAYNVEQVTWRPVWLPTNNTYKKIYNKYSISPDQIKNIRGEFYSRGVLLNKLSYGAEIFDVDGVSFCLSNCMTRTVDTDDIRQLILFQDGSLRYDWEYRGALIV